MSRKTTGEPVPEPQKDTAGEAVHYGFGALLGGLYGAAGSVAPRVRTGFGTIFGTAVWAVADEIAVPARIRGSQGHSAMVPEAVRATRSAGAQARRSWRDEVESEWKRNPGVDAGVRIVEST